MSAASGACQFKYFYAGLRLDEVRTLAEFVWREDAPNLMVTGGAMAAVGLGLLLSAGGIFSLMSVRVARQTREIGLRSALGASPQRLIAGLFTRAFVLVGSGVAAGNPVMMVAVAYADQLDLGEIAQMLVITSAVMLTVGLLACVGPARRAFRIQPADALKEAWRVT